MREFSSAGVICALNIMLNWIQHLLRRYETLNQVQGDVSARRTEPSRWIDSRFDFAVSLLGFFHERKTRGVIDCHKCTEII